ncbi:MAG TPA: VanZ family protein [Thermoanaerobaculaceae bacterium]|nr:VanZ family protein [Thermoanaerobaculaceae bacterium]
MHAPRLLSVLLVAGLSVAYLILGTRPQNPAVVRDVPDKVLHGGAYAVLGLSAGCAAAALGVGAALLAGWAYAVAHGVLLEVVQHFTPPRTAEVGDVVADAVGAAAGAVALGWWRRRR